MRNQSPIPDFASKPAPDRWPRISSSLYYEDAAAAIDWLCRVFGFEVRMKVEGDDGRIIHSELEFGRDGMVMVCSVSPGADHGAKAFTAAPGQVGDRNTQNLCVVVDDADVHCAHAEAAGASILIRPETHDYGEEYWADRTYLAADLEGHRWWFLQRVRGPGVG